MFGKVDHLEMLLSIILSQPGNERFQFNVTRQTTNKCFLGFGRWGSGVSALWWSLSQRAWDVCRSSVWQIIYILGQAGVTSALSDLVPFNIFRAFLSSNISAFCCAQYRAFCPKRQQSVSHPPWGLRVDWGTAWSMSLCRTWHWLEMEHLLQLLVSPRLRSPSITRQILLTRLQETQVEDCSPDAQNPALGKPGSGKGSAGSSGKLRLSPEALCWLGAALSGPNLLAWLQARKKEK